MVWIVETNGCIIFQFIIKRMHRHIDVCEKKNVEISSWSHIKHGLNKLYFQVRNACNIQNINQRNIHRARPTG